jgi:hypothetical protein
MTKDEADKLKRSINRWAGVEVEVLVVPPHLHVEIEKGENREGVIVP